MKSRNKKVTACLLLSTLMLTLGAGTAQAAPADLSAASAPVSGVSLLVAQSNVQTEAAEAQAAQNLGVAQVDNYLNVREEASTDSSVVGIMKNDTVAEITGEQDGWYQISSGSITGYVKAEYLTVGDQALLDSVKSRKAQVNTETLKVRSEASTDASVVTLVGQEDQLSVTDEQTPGWIKVQTADGEGYISADYATVEDTYQYAEKPQTESSEAGSGSSVISYALQFVGNPYVWGGTSLTNGVDCSGFVMQVYAHYGISLPHSSAALRSVGRGVSYSEAQPGDIVCYSGHVGIYIGGGQIVHASNPRDGIKVSTATFKSILAVRRVM
ncbi:C40 family peptidase [uncultured Eubacterium sp.]|uniref:C40 family peptidase n=1 Tax=uncultured Eubacterium sp. TaxID=165185 RepID=UPI00260074E2|nr:C40 family peptidase [uncultured Eubacterium sp.]